MNPKSLIKLVVSATLVWVIVRVVNVSALATTFRKISPTTVLLVTLSYLFGQILSAIKWWIIVRASDRGVSLLTALKAYYIGMFVNVLGVGTVGGDMTRALLISHGEKGLSAQAGAKAVGVASVVADRAHGLTTLACIGMVATIAFGSASLPAYLFYLLVLLTVAVPIGWALGPQLLLNLVPEGHGMRSKAEGIARVFPKDAGTVALITVLSLTFHFVQIFIHRLMAVGLGASIPWSYLLVAVPFTNIVASLPVSWQGLGVRENAYRFFFVPAVLTPEQAVAFGALWLFAVTVAGCIGGVVSLVTNTSVRQTTNNSATNNSATNNSANDESTDTPKVQQAS